MLGIQLSMDGRELHCKEFCIGFRNVEQYKLKKYFIYCHAVIFNIQNEKLFVYLIIIS